MSKNTRLLFLAILLPSAFVLAHFITGNIVPTGVAGQWFFSGVLLLILSSFFLEHHYIKPSDVIANTIQVFTVLLLMYSELNEIGWSTGLWGAILTYTVIVFFMAFGALMLVDQNQSIDSKKNLFAGALKKVSLALGKGDVIYSVIFLASITFYFQTTSAQFFILIIYWAFLILLRPLGVTNWVETILNNKQVKNKSIGRVLYTETEDLINLELYRNIELSVGHAVITKKKDGYIYQGVIYSLSNTPDKTIAKVFLITKGDDELQTHKIAFNEFASITGIPELTANNVIGLVADGSDISILKFFVYPQCQLKEGYVVKAIIHQTPVYYQIINAVDREEVLTGQSTYGKTIAVAKQIGEWVPDESCFENFGWVPLLNSPVFLVGESEEVSCTSSGNDFKIGVLPNTNFPVIADIDSLVTHHTAIIGITGSGKTRMTRSIVSQIVTTDKKVICVDFTGEYVSLFGSFNPKPLVKPSSTASINKSLEIIHKELEKFENAQNKDTIDDNTKIISQIFEEEILEFINDTTLKVGIFELPEILNTKGALDYTKYFFKVLFKLARSRLIGAGLAIVLEEAHTIVPEGNFLSTDDKLSKSVMNAIGQIALQGRKHGIGFIVITQRTANVSKTILTQCNSIICFRIYDNTGLEFLSNYVGKEMISAIPNLSVKKGNRQAVVIGKAFNSKSPVITKIPEQD